MIDWTSKEAEQLFEQWGQSKGEADDVLSLASLAIELIAARDGIILEDAEVSEPI